MKVSIVIPTYNRRNLIVRTLKSVLQQSYQNIEVIIVDDGSTDDTKEILSVYLERQNVTYLYQSNKGRSAARNFGIRKASGEFLMFLDSDDYLEPDALETLVNLSVKYPDVNIIAASYRLIEENISGNQYEIYKREYEFIEENILLQQVRMMVLNIGNNIIKKHLVERYGGFEAGLEYAEDWKLLVNICSKEKAVVIKKVILNVLRHEDNSSFFHIQDAIINISKRFIEQIKRNQFPVNDGARVKLKAELNKRIGMAYSRKGEKLASLKYFYKALQQQPQHLLSDLSFMKELAYVLIPADILIYLRRLQLKIGTKELAR